MSNKNILQLKAAIIFAAFFVLKPLPVNAKDLENFDEIKKKSSELFMKKQKTEALQLVVKFLKQESNKNQINEANDLIVKLSQTFISKEAQEAYESSLNATLETPKEASKQIEACLQLEPENIDCLVQKIRLAYREKNTSVVEITFKKLGEFAAGTNLYSWVDAFLQKDLPGSDFKEKNILKKINEKPNDEVFILNVLEIERSFLVKNLSKVKLGLEFLEKNYPDYPENIYFKQKLDADSIDEKTQGPSDSSLMYLTKCKSLSRSMARRFRYDFALCKRSLP